MNRRKFRVTGVLVLVAAGTAVATTPASAAPKPVTPAAATPGGALPAGFTIAVTVAAGLAPAAQAGLRSAAAVPLTVAVGQRATATFSRQGDIAPYWGGARYVNSSGNVCTTGIPMLIGDALAMQSAGHCADQFSAVTVPGVPGTAGTVLGKQTCKDTLLINFTGGVSQGLYTGDQNSGTSANIRGAAFDFVGNLTAAGGASSGEHLNIPVQAVDLFTSDTGGIPCGSVGPLTKAGYSSATCAVALGDSGGPAYSRTGDGQGVLVRGTISMAVGRATCPGSQPDGFNTVYWAPAVRPSGSLTPGTLDFYRASVPYVTTYFLTGTWTDGPGRGPGPKINVFGDTIEVDMSAFHRPAARGFVLNPDVITVRFPDERPHVATLISPTQIRWDNGSIWTKL